MRHKGPEWVQKNRYMGKQTYHSTRKKIWREFSRDMRQIWEANITAISPLNLKQIRDQGRTIKGMNDKTTLCIRAEGTKKCKLEGVVYMISCLSGILHWRKWRTANNTVQLAQSRHQKCKIAIVTTRKGSY